MSLDQRSDRWMLPDGIEEMLPERAACIQALRRTLLDQFRAWGYDYVIPPMVEFVESLLTGTGRDSDLDLRTSKLTDQLTGKLMGVRADITPQVARIDAHSMQCEGVNRLCYSGHVMHARPRSPLASRIPIQAGVEIFGEPSVAADIEVTSLMADSLQRAGIHDLHIDLAQVNVFRSLVHAAKLNQNDETVLRELVRNRRVSELHDWLSGSSLSPALTRSFSALPEMIGGIEVLDRAAAVFDGVIDFASIQGNLEACYNTLNKRFEGISISFDLSELRGYSYHTGIVFGAYTGSAGHSIASGGRYDKVGESFGRARPATGFVINVSALAGALDDKDYLSAKTAESVFVPASVAKIENIWPRISELRQANRRVVVGLTGQDKAEPHQRCTHAMAADGSIATLQTDIKRSM